MVPRLGKSSHPPKVVAQQGAFQRNSMKLEVLQLPDCTESHRAAFSLRSRRRTRADIADKDNHAPQTEPYVSPCGSERERDTYWPDCQAVFAYERRRLGDHQYAWRTAAKSSRHARLASSMTEEAQRIATCATSVYLSRSGGASWATRQSPKVGAERCRIVDHTDLNAVKTCTRVRRTRNPERDHCKKHFRPTREESA